MYRGKVTAVDASGVYVQTAEYGTLGPCQAVGTAGVGQYVVALDVGDESAPDLVVMSTQSISVKAFGATGDGTTDDTAAVQAAFDAAVAAGASLYFPAGDYRTAGGVTVATGVTVRGDGPTESVIRGYDGDVLTISGSNHSWADIGIYAHTGADHAVVVPVGSSLSMSRFSKVNVTALPTTSSCWRYDNSDHTVDGGLYDVHWIDCTFQHRTSGTVNPIYIQGGHCFAANKFTRCRFHSSGVPFVNVEIIKSGVYAYSNSFDQINFEVCNGGGIRITSGLNNAVRNAGFFDVGTVTGDLIMFTRMSTGSGDGIAKAHSRNNLVENYHRSNGTIGAYYDVRQDSGSRDLTIVGITGPASAGVTANLGNYDALVVGASAANVTLANTTATTIVGSSTIAHPSAGTVGFFGAAPTTQPTVTGSRGGNAALASLLTQLATLGLIVDSTT